MNEADHRSSLDRPEQSGTALVLEEALYLICTESHRYDIQCTFLHLEIDSICSFNPPSAGVFPPVTFTEILKLLICELP